MKGLCEWDWSEALSKLKHHLGERSWHHVLKSLLEIKNHFGDGIPLKNEGDILIILDACRQLDDMAHEKGFRNDLAAIILVPLIESSQNKPYLKTVENYIKINMPFGKYGSIKQPPLFDHQAESFEEYCRPLEHDPYVLLKKVRSDYVQYLQSNPEQYEEAAIVYLIIGYWRLLTSSSYNNYEKSDIVPLLQIGETLLHLAKETGCSPLKKRECWRMVLLLQILINDHPAIKQVDASKWPKDGFTQGIAAEAINDPSSSLHKEAKQIESKGQLFPRLVLNFNFNSKDRHFSSLINKDNKTIIEKSRLIFHDRMGGEILSAQYQHSTAIVAMLNEMIQATIPVFGAPPCSVAICALGSTARCDRRPYSDLELLILHSEPDLNISSEEKVRWEAQTAVYIYHITTVLELMIIRLGETPNHKMSVDKQNAGFHFDSSCHVLMRDARNKVKWGTPRQIIDRYFSEIHLEVALGVKEKTHPWKDNVNFFSLIQPLLLHPGSYGGDRLIQDYQLALKTYLDDIVYPNDRPDVLAQQLDLSHQWSKGLKRRQAIALVCLHDIVEKSVNAYRNLEHFDEANIKDIFYKPLSYSAITLGLYYKKKEKVPQKIIQDFCQSMQWGGQALLAWWQGALAYVVEQQVRLHLKNRYQEEELVYELNECWAGMDLISEGFILPLQNIVRECLSGSMSINKIADVLLISYMGARKNWLDKWTKKGLDRERLLAHPLIQILSKYPNEAGWTPYAEQMLKRHHDGLSTLSLTSKTACQFSGMPGEEKKTRFLKESLIQQCFKKGEFVGDPELSTSRSQVKEILVDDKAWYIKVKEGNKEGLMGREYLAMMVQLLLGGEPNIALGWPIKLTYVAGVHAKPYYAWISEGVAGHSLGARMRQFPKAWASSTFDRESFSQLFLFTFLTCPEDGQPENFKVIEHDGNLRLIAIDYGQCFVGAERKEKVGFFSSEVSVLTIKTMIYLLDAMEEQLSEELITRIRLLDSKVWYSQCKSAIDGINELFKPLLKADRGANAKSENEESDRLINIPESVMLCIKTRLELLQIFISTTKKPITGKSVLESLEPLVAHQYASLRPIITTAEDFYQKIDVKAYIKDRKTGKIASRATVDSLQQHTLSPERLVNCCNLQPSYFYRIDLRQLDKVQQEFHIQLLETVAESKGNEFIKLNLCGTVIEENRLILLLEKMPNLQELDLMNCPNLSYWTVAKIIAHRSKTSRWVIRYELLCPVLSVICVTVEGVHYELRLTADRYALAERLEEFLALADRVVPRLLKQLVDSEYDLKRSAAEALGYIGMNDERVIDELFFALDDHHVYESVAKALGQLGKANKRIYERLLEAMDICPPAGWDRMCTAHVLGHLGKVDDRIIEFLLKTLGRGSWHVTKSAIDALGRLGKADDRVMSSLLLYSQHDKWRVREAGVEAIVRLGKVNDRVLDVLVELLGDSKWEIRKSVAQALVSLDKVNNRVIEALVKALGDSQEQVSRAVADAIIHFGIEVEGHFVGVQAEFVREALKKAANDVKEYVWNGAAETLRRLEEKAYHRMNIEVLKELGNSDPILRSKAELALDRLLDSLRRQGDKLDVRVWDSLMIEDDKLVSLGIDFIPRLSSDDLRFLGRRGDRLIEELLRYIDSSNSRYRISAAEALMRIGILNDLVKDILCEALNNSKTYQRKRIAESLGYLEKADDRVVEELVKATADSCVCSAAVTALDRLQKLDPRVHDALLVAINNRDYFWILKLSSTDWSCLGRMSYRVTEALVEALLKALKDSDSQLMGITALKYVGCPHNDVISALLKRLENKDRNIASAAAEALGVILQPANCWNRIQGELRSKVIPTSLIPMASEITAENRSEESINPNDPLLGHVDRPMLRGQVSCFRRNRLSEEEAPVEVIKLSAEVDATSQTNILLEQANQAYLAAQKKGITQEDFVNNLDVALKQMDSLIVLEPKNPKFHLLKAKYLASKGGSTNMLQSIAVFEESLKCCSFNDDSLRCEILTERGITFSFLNESDKAIADYTEILKINPNAHRVRLNRAALMSESKRNYKEALAEFSYVIDHCTAGQIYLEALRYRLNTALILEEYSVVVQDANDYLREHPGDLLIESKRDQALLKLDESPSLVKNNK